MRQFIISRWDKLRRLVMGRIAWRALGASAVILGAVFLGTLLWSYWPVLVGFKWQFRWWPLALGMILYPVDLLLAVFAWTQVLESLETTRLPFRKHWKIYALTLVAGRIPGAPWHIAGRAVMYEQYQISKRITGLASGLELILMIVSGLLTGALIIPIVVEKVQLWLLVSVVLLGLGMLHPKVTQWLLKLLKRDIPPPRPYWEKLIWLGMYSLVWLVGGAILYCFINTITLLSITSLPYVMGIWGLSGAIAIMAFFSPSGFGIREVTLTVLLSLVLPMTVSGVISIIARIFFTILEFMSAFVAYKTKT